MRINLCISFYIIMMGSNLYCKQHDLFPILGIKTGNGTTHTTLCSPMKMSQNDNRDAINNPCRKSFTTSSQGQSK